MGSLSQSCRVTHLQLAAVPSQPRHMSVCTICQSADVSKTSTCLHRKTPLSPRSLRHHHTLAVLAFARPRSYLKKHSGLMEHGRARRKRTSTYLPGVQPTKCFLQAAKVYTASRSAALTLHT